MLIWHDRSIRMLMIVVIAITPPHLVVKQIRSVFSSSSWNIFALDIPSPSALSTRILD